ncbi:MAG: DUF692 domain-containing protein [Proteobacteria bacterium]|nr:DUF692 domain-containing protein [Pseudomonadota bacterium]
MKSRAHNFSGFGLGFRPQHFPDILGGANAADGVDWFEIISENFIGVGGMPMRNLMRVSDDYPIVMHGVSLSIGAPDPLDRDYLQGLMDLAERLQPEVISDHLCWTGAHGVNLHDLLPLPLTAETLVHVADRVGQVQDFLGRRIALENASTYVTFTADARSEWEFLSELSERADCELLLDVNNVYVSAFNHGFDAADYIAGLPAKRIRQIHLAGHENNGDHIVDTHDAPVADPVWDLYRDTIRLLGPVPTMIERDANIPPFADLVAELQLAREAAGKAGHGAAA